MDHECKDAALRSVVAVQEAAHRRALAEHEAAYARLSVEELSYVPDDVGFLYATQRWRFTRQLRNTADSLAVDLAKAVNDRTMCGQQFAQKKDELTDVAISAHNSLCSYYASSKLSL